MRADAHALDAWVATDRLTRRHLLQTGAAAALAAGLGGTAGLLARRTSAAARSVPARSAYAPLVGERFLVRGPDARRAHLRLVDVGDLRGVAAGHEGAFSLLFHGPSTPRLPQDVYSVFHPSIGTSALLLAPAGTGRRGQDYAAIVNRVPTPNR